MKKWIFTLILICLLLSLLFLDGYLETSLEFQKKIVIPKQARIMEFRIITGPPYYYIPSKPAIKEKLIQVQVNVEKKCRQHNGEYIPIRASCVCWAKEAVRYKGEIGNAINWPRNSDSPIVNGVVIMKSKLYNGHVAVITKIEGKKLYLKEANYKPGIVSERVILLNDDKIIGFWYDKKD